MTRNLVSHRRRIKLYCPALKLDIVYDFSAEKGITWTGFFLS